MRLGIRAKLLLTFLGSVVAILLVLAGAVGATVIYWNKIAGVAGVSPFRILGEAQTYAARTQAAVTAGADLEALRRAAVPPDRPAVVRVWVVDVTGRVWIDTNGGEGRIASHEELLTALAQSEPNGGHTLTLPQPLTKDGKVWGFYLITVPLKVSPQINLTDGSAQSRTVNMIFLGGLAVALSIAIALFWTFGLHLLRPVRQLSAVVGRLAAGDLSARSALGRRTDEIGQLARDVDTMAERLEAARLRAEAAERSRRYLVAAASHDLRTPLTALLAHAEALQGGVSEDPAQSLTVIHEKGMQLKRLIDDLLELSALDASAEGFQTLRTDLAELVRREVVSILPELEAEGVEVEAEIPDGPLWSNLAPGKIERVMQNLLANARKYAAAGRWIGVTVRRRGDRLRVEVADRGPGVPESERAQIFERFYRSDAARGAAGGSGLGLAITKEIVARHGGTVGVESPPEGGARFWFEVPAADCKPPES